jgi:protein-S-isoprenylcysteine O-methyltransferase Ste14
VRHPMYAGASVLLIATPLALGSWFAEIFAVLLIMVVAIRLLDEEKVLKQNLAGYPEYCGQVRYHLVPYVW